MIQTNLYTVLPVSQAAGLWNILWHMLICSIQTHKTASVLTPLSSGNQRKEKVKLYRKKQISVDGSDFLILFYWDLKTEKYEKVFIKELKLWLEKKSSQFQNVGITGLCV